MSPDDIDTVVLKLHDFLWKRLGCALHENDDYEALSDFMYDTLDKFVTRDRNHN